jgi:hypothetical protein
MKRVHITFSGLDLEHLHEQRDYVSDSYDNKNFAYSIEESCDESIGDVSVLIFYGRSADRVIGLAKGAAEFYNSQLLISVTEVTDEQYLKISEKYDLRQIP